MCILYVEISSSSLKPGRLLRDPLVDPEAKASKLQEESSAAMPIDKAPGAIPLAGALPK